MIYGLTTFRIYIDVWLKGMKTKTHVFVYVTNEINGWVHDYETSWLKWKWWRHAEDERILQIFLQSGVNINWLILMSWHTDMVLTAFQVDFPPRLQRNYGDLKAFSIIITYNVGKFPSGFMLILLRIEPLWSYWASSSHSISGAWYLLSWHMSLNPHISLEQQNNTSPATGL